MARQRLPEAARRRALVDAAIEVARDRGLALLTGRDVAARADVSVGLVHYHFGTIEQLMVELFERVQREDLASARAVTEAEPEAPRAMAALVDYFLPAPGDWRYRLWVDAWSLAPRQPAVRDIARELNLAWRDLVLGIVHRGRTAGAFAVSDPAAAAWTILALLDAMHLQLSTEQIDADLTRVRRWVRRSVAAELGIATLPRRVLPPA